MIYNLCEKLDFLDELILYEYNEWASNPDDNREERIALKHDKILKQLGQKDFCKLILIVDDKLAGFISIFPHDSIERPDLYGWYSTMFVVPNYRGLGYSKILNDAILLEAKKRGFNRLYLKTELNNYYEKFGAKYMENINDFEKIYYFDL